MSGSVAGRVPADTDETAELRERMVTTLLEHGEITTPAVAAALRAVPRHLFLPDTAPEVAYRPFDAVVTGRDDNGAAVTSISAPQAHAVMAEQADLRPGMRVLEIGSGGFNAALLAHLVGPDGEIVSVDIDPDVVARARDLLDANGCSRVRVVQVDAEGGYPDLAPYDRVVVTAGAWDVPPAWVSQLVPGGRLVVPLRMRGLTRILALDPVPDGGPGDGGVGHLVARSARLFGFVPVRGRGAHTVAPVVVDEGAVTLVFDDDHHVGPDTVADAFTWPRVESWTGVRVGREESLAVLQLWLAGVAPNFCSLRADPDRDSGPVVLGRSGRAMAAVAGDTLAHLVLRPTAQEPLLEYGVHAYGPQADGLADLLTRQLHVWDALHRDGPGPTIRLYPTGTPDARIAPGHVIDKRHRRVVLSWPDSTLPDDTVPDGAVAGGSSGW